jgi:type II secretory pathway pseudopilin PulG
MVKKIIAVVLILATAGAWVYLDYQNKQQQLAAAEMRKAIEQMRAQAQARVAARAKFEAQINSDLATCKASATKAKEDFLVAHQQPVRKKQGQFSVPKAAMDEADKTLEVANAACQATYETHLKSGS